MPTLGLGLPLRPAADLAAARGAGEGSSLVPLHWVEVSPAGLSRNPLQVCQQLIFVNVFAFSKRTGLGRSSLLLCTARG